MTKKWFLYVIRCADDTLYTGITTDLQRRLIQHNTKKGAKAVKGKLPVEFVYSETCADRSHASKREYFIKKLAHKEKLTLAAK